MPLPRWVARFNKRVTNRFFEPLASRFNNFGVVLHVGRRSGRPYRTPVNYFRAAGTDRLVVALTYGPEADWAQNVIAAGGSIETIAGLHRMSAPHLVGRSAAWPHLPLPVRLAMRVLRVHDFLMFTVEPKTSR